MGPRIFPAGPRSQSFRPRLQTGELPAPAIMELSLTGPPEKKLMIVEALRRVNDNDGPGPPADPGRPVTMWEGGALPKEIGALREPPLITLNRVIIHRR